MSMHILYICWGKNLPFRSVSSPSSCHFPRTNESRSSFNGVAAGYRLSLQPHLVLPVSYHVRTYLCNYSARARPVLDGALCTVHTQSPTNAPRHTPRTHCDTQSACATRATPLSCSAPPLLLLLLAIEFSQADTSFLAWVSKYSKWANGLFGNKVGFGSFDLTNH